MTPEISNPRRDESAETTVAQEVAVATAAGSKFPNWLAWSFLVLALLVAAGVRVRLLETPLERDEGEYAYAGQLITEGIPPYQLAYNMKMPGTYLAYAAVMSVFGQTAAGIHLGLLVVHLATLAVLFLVARKLLDLPGAVIATSAYALMTLSPACFGLAAHATHFVMLPALAGVWVLLQIERHGRLTGCLLAGVLFGVAFLMKQQGVFFGVFGGLWLAWFSLAGKVTWPQAAARLGLYGLGCLLPLLAVCWWLKISGVFPAFWFWTVSYAREYASLTPLSQGYERAQSALAIICRAAPLVWLLAGVGLAGLGVARRTPAPRAFLAGFLLFSFLAVCPGFYFRGHYFIVLLPAVALLAGFCVSWGGHWLARLNLKPWVGCLPFLVAVVACGQSLFADRAVLFQLSPREACQAIYGRSPFVASPALGRYIEENSQPGERVVVIGSEPQIYFYARRHSSTGFIYLFPLMENQPFARTMQEDMIREIEKNPPDWLVLVSISTSWLGQPDSSTRILDWAGDYLNQQMQQVGLIQYTNADTPESAWGSEAATVPVRTENYVAVFRRTPAPGPDQQQVARNRQLMELLRNAQPDGAISLYQAALDRHPNDASAHFNLGNAFAWKGQTNEALAQLETAVRLDPNFADAHYNLGNDYLQSGRAEQAVREFSEVVRIAPHDADAHYYLGQALIEAGRTDAAITELQSAFRLKTYGAEVHYNLGNLLAKQGQTDAAVAEFQAAIRLQPDAADAHNNLGNLLAKTGQTEAAIHELQEAVRLKPADADTHYNLGNLLLRTGRLDDAISELKSTVNRKPDFAPAHYNLAVALNKKGEAEAAISEFREAIRLQPDYAIAHNSLGIALAAQGRMDDAITEFQAALRIKPDYASAQNNLSKARALTRNPK